MSLRHPAIAGREPVRATCVWLSHRLSIAECGCLGLLGVWVFVSGFSFVVFRRSAAKTVCCSWIRA